MGEFAVKTTIDAPVSAVWSALADIGEIHAWNPGVVGSHATSAEPTGLGATRHCDLKGNNFLKEEVVTFRPNEAITFRITDTNLPFRSADIRFTLTPDGDQTIVTCSPVYKLKFGLFGSLIDALAVRRTYSNGMKSLLWGLKKHVEAERE